jgi:hypothetical protein
VHGTGVYSAGVGPKGPALERFLDIKKKIYIYIYICIIKMHLAYIMDLVNGVQNPNKRCSVKFCQL